MQHCRYCGHEHNEYQSICPYCYAQPFPEKERSQALSAVAHVLEQRFVTRILSALVNAGVISKEDTDK